MTQRPTDSVFPTTPQGYVFDTLRIWYSTIETRISKIFSYCDRVDQEQFKKNAIVTLKRNYHFDPLIYASF